MQALACSLRRSNPGLPLIVLTAEGDLQPSTLESVRQFGQLHIVPDFSIPNFNLPRFALDAASRQQAHRFQSNNDA